MDGPTQNLKNHPRFIPGFHFLLSAILLANFIWSIVHLFKTGLSFDTGRTVIMAFAFMQLFYYTRTFATRNQDRIIRLEMRVRMRDSLPQDLRGRVGELTTEQLIALRFASDAELPGLTKKVLEERVMKRSPIKAMIKDWQGDFQRV
jgi:hypothetical protein